MGNKEILDYVMNSPGNTNKAVLKGLLGDTASGGSSNGVFMVEEDLREDDTTKIELKATWQEICDVVKSGKLVGVYYYSENPSDPSMFMYVSNIVDTVSCNPNASKPYIVHCDNQEFGCLTPNERPYITVDSGPV